MERKVGGWVGGWGINPTLMYFSTNNSLGRKLIVMFWLGIVSGSLNSYSEKLFNWVKTLSDGKLKIELPNLMYPGMVQT